MSGVFDASALLAIILNERGSDIVMAYIRNGIVSAVNIVEVIQRMADHGVGPEKTLEQLARLEIEIISFDLPQAAIVAGLRAKTKQRGVSLADRACIALAIHRALPVFTSDQLWPDLDLGIDIRMIR